MLMVPYRLPVDCIYTHRPDRDQTRIALAVLNALISYVNMSVGLR
jgi:hypothetical protein